LIWGKNGPLIKVNVHGDFQVSNPIVNQSISKSKFMSKYRVTILDYRVLQLRQPQYEKNNYSWHTM